MYLFSALRTGDPAAVKDMVPMPQESNIRKVCPAELEFRPSARTYALQSGGKGSNCRPRLSFGDLNWAGL